MHGGMHFEILLPDLSSLRNSNGLLVAKSVVSALSHAVAPRCLSLSEDYVNGGYWR